MFSKLLVVMGVAVVAVNAQGSGPSQCVLDCAIAGQGEDGCAITDASCVCTSGQYQQDVAQCLATYCTAADAAEAAALQSQLCDSASGTLTVTSPPTGTNILSITLTSAASGASSGSSEVTSTAAGASSTPATSESAGTTTTSTSVTTTTSSGTTTSSSSAKTSAGTTSTSSTKTSSAPSASTSTTSGATSTRGGVSAIVLSLIAGFLVL